MTQDEIQRIEWAGPLKLGREPVRDGEIMRVPIQTCPACSRERGAGHAEWCFIADALRSRPAPPDDLALRHAWEAGFRLCRSYGDNHHHFDGEQKERKWRDYIEGLAAPAPVAAPAPETPANEHIVCYDPDGNPLVKVVNINAAGNTDVGVYAMPQLKPETPAPDAMPAIQVGDEVYYESNTGLRLASQHAVDEAVDPDDPIIRIERNGVVIWRRQGTPPDTLTLPRAEVEAMRAEIHASREAHRKAQP